MRKKLVVLGLGVVVIAGVLCGCVGKSGVTSKKAADSSKTVTTEAKDSSKADTTETKDSSAKDKKENSAKDKKKDAGKDKKKEANSLDSIYAGKWHEKIAGRASMKVTVAGDNVKFDVTWSDSANKAYTWKFKGQENEAGIVCYSDGVKSEIEYDEDGNETKTTVTDKAEGEVIVTMDDVLEWTENGEKHEFVRD